MDSKNLLKKYRKRLALYGALKSVFIGFVAAFTVMGGAALITWLIKAPLSAVIGFSVGSGAVTALICIPVFYFLRFRPTTEGTARQVDALGMDERLITMCEFEKDESTLASIQRDDAREKLSGVPAKRLKLRVPAQLALLLACSFVFAASFMTVSVLAAADVIKDGGEVMGGGGQQEEENKPAEELFTVYYLVYTDGSGEIPGEISGKAVQTVRKGGFTKEVTAVPAQGYSFYAWVDADKNPFGNQENPRVDVNVREDMKIYALFYKKEENIGGDDPTQNGPESDKPHKDDGDRNEEPGSGDEQGSGESSGDGGGDGGSESSGGSAPGRENNTVVDGKQDYRDYFDRERFEQELEEDKSIPDDLKDILGDYYDILKP